MAKMGIMNEGYFVGRKELTSWIREHFDGGFQKVEDLASGAIYCQILNAVHPGSVQMSKVKLGAKTQVDFIHNFKQLQAGFTKKKIDRYIEVDKLIKRSFQYNMEFLQFMKCYWDMNSGDAPAQAMEEGLKENNKPALVADKPAAAKRGPEAKEVVASGARRIGGASSKAAAAAPGSPTEAPKQEHAHEVTELKLAVENLERERDFYYAKLREVEVLCQAKETAGDPACTVAEVLAILYKMDETDEFEPPVD